MGTDRRGFLKGLLGTGAAALGLGRVGTGQAQTRPEPSQAYETHRFYVAGFQFHNGPKIVSQMRKGDPLAMILEPENSYDRLAVRLEWKGTKIGYVPRTENPVINKLLQQNAPLTCFIRRVKPDSRPWWAVRCQVKIVGASRGSERPWKHQVDCAKPCAC